MASAKDVANRVAITAVITMATLMVTIDSTIATVALPHIQGSVSASADQVTWVLTSYIIATAVMTPLSGWLSERIGRKSMLLLSIGGFTVSSMLCGVATSIPEIVVFRLLQGVAGASLIPLSQAIMLDIFPARSIPRVISVWSSAVVLGPIIGPTLGGWLTEDLSWRWVFYINLPLGVLAFLGILAFMDRDEGGRQRPFDSLGYGALVLLFGGFQLMVDRGPLLDWFDSKEIWLETATCIAGLYVFVIQSATAAHPFFHRDLIKDGNFVGTTIYGFFVGALLTSTSALIPSFMQNLLGYSALQSGLASMPRGVGSLLAFVAGPVLMTRLGARTVLIAGLCLSVVALWQVAQFDLSMTSTPIMAAGFLQGVGMALIFAPLTSLAYVTLPARHRTEATILATLARSLGSSAGISVLQALLIRDGAAAHAAIAGRLDAADPMIAWSLPAGLNPGSLRGLELLNAEVTRQGMMISYDAVFGGMAVVAALLVPPLLLLKTARPSADGPDATGRDAIAMDGAHA